MLTNPKLEIIPRFSEGEIMAIEQRSRECFAGVSAAWYTFRAEIIDILTNDKGLSRAVGNYHPDELPELFARMDSFVAGENPFNVFPGFHRFRTSGIDREL